MGNRVRLVRAIAFNIGAIVAVGPGLGLNPSAQLAGSGVTVGGGAGKSPVAVN
jgi:hypothetical protein